jgi:hypothetical protein
MSQLNRLPSETLRALPCADGSVTITEVASSAPGDEWQWQLTLVDIGRDVEFPAHADIRRQFVPLDAAVAVTFPDGRTLHLKRFDLAHFDHLNAPEGCHPESSTRAFNLKLRNDTQGELIVRPLNGTMVLLAPGGWRWFVLLLSGQAKVVADHRTHDLLQNDMLWIDPIPGHPVRIEGGGEIVLARLPIL